MANNLSVLPLRTQDLKKTATLDTAKLLFSIIIYLDWDQSARLMEH